MGGASEAEVAVAPGRGERVRGGAEATLTPGVWGEGSWRIQWCFNPGRRQRGGISYWNVRDLILSRILSRSQC